MDMHHIEYKQSPFNCYLILKEIEKNLKIRELREARKVNKMWNSIFSKRIKMKIPPAKELRDFFQFTVPSYYLESENYIRKFSIDKSWNRNVLIASNMRKLIQIYQIKELYLPEINSIRTLKSILDVISGTLEHVEIKQFSIDEELTENIDFKKSGQSLSKLSNLKHIMIYFEYSQHDNELFNYFFETLLTASSSNLQMMTFSGLSENALKPLKFMSLQDMPKLKTFNFFDEDSVVEVTLLPELIANVNKHKPTNIIFYKVKLTWNNFEDFIRLIALYDKFWSKYKTNEYYYSKIKVNTVKYFDRAVFYIPLAKAFWHFPNLEAVITWSNRKWMEKLKNDKFEKMKILKYYEDSTANIKYNITENITNIFPNLTFLKLIIDGSHTPRLNLIPIFGNLKKLETFIFKHTKSPLSFVPDRDLTGIPDDFIKNNLLGKSYEYLRDFDWNLIPERNHTGIANLTELRKFEMSVYYGNYAIPLMFACRFLYKLKSLTLDYVKSTETREDILRVFIEYFDKLEFLNLNEISEELLYDSPLYEELNIKKPQIEIGVIEDEEY